MRKAYSRRKDYLERSNAICAAFGVAQNRSGYTDLLRKLYFEEMVSTGEISERFQKMTGLRIEPRSIQRWIARHVGKLRPLKTAFNLAIEQGRVRFQHQRGTALRRKTLSVKTRYEVLSRDGFRCALCGASGAEAYLEVGHRLALVYSGTDAKENLQTQCWECNKGKQLLNREHRLGKLFESGIGLEN